MLPPRRAAHPAPWQMPYFRHVSTCAYIYGAPAPPPGLPHYLFISLPHKIGSSLAAAVYRFIKLFIRDKQLRSVYPPICLSCVGLLLPPSPRRGDMLPRCNPFRALLFPFQSAARLSTLRLIHPDAGYGFAGTTPRLSTWRGKKWYPCPNTSMLVHGK